MMIVRDINDAMTMRNKLRSLVRRSHNGGWSRATMIIELCDIIEDLDKNIEREESLLEDEVFLKSA
jgi:hypothetical protein